MTRTLAVRLPRTLEDATAAGLLCALVVLPLYPKVALVGVSGTYIPVRIDDLLIAGLALLWGATLIRRGARPPAPPAWPGAAAWLAAGALALAIGVATGSIGALRGLLYWGKPAGYLLLAWIAFDVVRRRPALPPLIVRTVLVTAGAVVVYGLLQGIGLDLPSPTDAPARPEGVVLATFGDPHELSLYLGVIIALAVAVWADERTGGRVLLGALVVGAVLVMSDTGARSEFLAVAAGLGLALLFRRTRVPAAAGLAVLLTVVAVAGLKHDAGTPVATPTGGAAGRVLSTGPGADTSLNQRFDVKWPALLHQFERRPVTGLGPSAAGEGADGFYVRTLVESGVVGLLAFSAMIAAVALALWRTPTPPARGLLAATAFLVLTGVLLDTWAASRPMEAYWPLAGACLAACTPAASRARPSSGARQAATAPSVTAASR